MSPASSTADPERFKALLAYSPYQHVEQGVKYPAVFMATGENDGRVNLFDQPGMNYP